MDNDQTPRHPIRVAAQRAGLSPAALRAWERRYSAVEPQRSETGRRLYSDANVRRLRLLSEAVAGGRGISLVAKLPNEELEELLREDRASVLRLHDSTSRPFGESRVDDRVREALGHVEAMRPDELESFLKHSAVALPAGAVVDEVVLPLLYEIGIGWHEGRVGPGAEHIASVSVRRFLEWLLATIQVPSGAPLLLAGTPEGQVHEFGALLAAVVAAEEGWRVQYLGPRLPGSEIVRTASTMNASAIALSAVFPVLPPEIADQIIAMRAALPSEILVLVGGVGAAPFSSAFDAAGIPFCEDLDRLRVLIAERSQVRAAATESARQIG